VNSLKQVYRLRSDRTARAGKSLRGNEGFAEPYGLPLGETIRTPFAHRSWLIYMKNMKICFTGHRNVRRTKQIAETLERIANKYPGATWICGGAVGLDSAAATFAMERGIDLWLILPFPPAVMTKYWSTSQKATLGSTIKYASRLSVVSPRYDVAAYQHRNMRMVDLSDLCVAFFDGSPGGTANCVKYARYVGRDLVVIDPTSPFRNI